MLPHNNENYKNIICEHYVAAIKKIVVINPSFIKGHVNFTQLNFQGKSWNYQDQDKF